MCRLVFQMHIKLIYNAIYRQQLDKLNSNGIRFSIFSWLFLCFEMFVKKIQILYRSARVVVISRSEYIYNNTIQQYSCLQFIIVLEHFHHIITHLYIDVADKFYFIQCNASKPQGNLKVSVPARWQLLSFRLLFLSHVIEFLSFLLLLLLLLLSMIRLIKRNH